MKIVRRLSLWGGVVYVYDVGFLKKLWVVLWVDVRYVLILVIVWLK